MQPVSNRGFANVAAALIATASVLAACAGSAANTLDTDGRPRVAIVRAFVDEHHDVIEDELRSQGWQPGRDLVLLPDDPTEIYEDVEEARAALRSWEADGGLDLILAFSTPYAELAVEEHPDTPTLFVVNDPVASGLLDDTQRPRDQLSGVTFQTPADRTLDLASRAIGGIERLGYLVPVDDVAVEGHRAGVLDVAAAAGIDVVEEHYDSSETIVAAAERLASADVDAVWLANSNAVLRFLPELEEHLATNGLPTIANTEHPAFAVVVVTPDGAELRRQLARQASRALAGTSLASIPVEDPRRFFVAINASQIEAFDLPPVPRALLWQADVVR